MTEQGDELRKLYALLNEANVPMLICDRAIKKTELDHPEYKIDYSIARSYIKRAVGEFKNIIQNEIKKYE